MNRGKGPLVSAVVTTFNRPGMAKRAIESALAQSYMPLEIIVVEDGSKSNIEEWMERNKLTQVRYFRHEQNRGLAAARNTGFRKSQGNYVAFLDDDDEWLPEKLTKQVKLFESQEQRVGMIYCGGLRVSPETPMGREKRPQLRGHIRTAIRDHSLSTIPSSCLFRRDALEQINGYDENLESHVDFDILLQLAQKEYAIECMDECLVKVHCHNSYSMTTDIEARVRATGLFCDKWKAELQNWLGRKRARQFCCEFRAQVLGMLGWTCFYKGETMESAKYFLLALRYNLARRENYVGLISIGKRFAAGASVRTNSKRNRNA